MVKKETLEDKIKSVMRKRDEAYVEFNSKQQELNKLMELYYEEGDTHEKIVCINCGGQGYVQIEDKGKQICKACNGKKYLWLPKFKEQPKTKEGN